MPFFRVVAGHALHSTAASYILANGIPPEIYDTPVRVIGIYPTEPTVFQIECADETIANEWADALIFAESSVVEYVPETVEDPDPPPTPLGVWSKVGTWSKSIGNATTVISSLPGQPKGIIIWSSGLSGAAMGTYNDAGGAVIGFSDGGSFHRCVSLSAQDNVNPSNIGRGINSKPLHMFDPTQAGTAHITEKCNSISFGATSFTMNWNATTLATTGFYFVFGGADILECKVKDFQTEVTTPGKHTYTGLGNQFDFGLLLYGGFAGVGFAEAQANGMVTALSCHASQEDTKSFGVSVTAADAVSPTTQWRLQKMDRVSSSMSTAGSAQGQAAKWAGWTSDGFVLDWFDPPSVTNNLFCGLFVRGGHWECGRFYQPITNGTKTTLLSHKFSQPQGIMGFSINNPNIYNNSGITDTRLMIGAQDRAGGKGCLCYGGNSGVATSVEATVMVNDKFMKHITPAATASSSTTDAECTVSSMTTDGQFTVDYTTTDATKRQVAWFSLSA